MKHPFATLALVGVLAAVTVACGSSSDRTETGAGDSTTTTTAPPGSAPGASAGDPDEPVESPPLDPGDSTGVPDMEPTIVEPHPEAVNQSETAIDRVRVREDGTLEVAFWNGVEACYQLGRVDVAETDSTVTITLWTGSNPQSQGMACIELAQYFATLVTLDAPLGDRTVIDGSTGLPAPLGG